MMVAYRHVWLSKFYFLCTLTSIHPFTYSFNKYLMSGLYVQGTTMSSENEAMDVSFFDWFVLCRCPGCGLLAKSCPVDCSLPGSSVHGIFQARILERVAMPFSRGFSRPRDGTHICLLHWQVTSLPPLPPGKP